MEGFKPEKIKCFNFVQAAVLNSTMNSTEPWTFRCVESV